MRFTPIYCAAFLAVATAASAQDICQNFGPQSPRDISNPAGSNSSFFLLAPPAEEMNLCNLHTHTQGEHKGPGFSTFVGEGSHGGYACNETPDLTEAELAAYDGTVSYDNVAPGDTVEVHWVYTTCNVSPGESLAACTSNACANPQLRVETQVFLVVNDPGAADFMDFAYMGTVSAGRHQPRSLPTDTGTPVVYAGSSTGDDFDDQICSPLQATFSVRPSCMKVDIASLNRWAEQDTAFNEHYSHGIRALVTAEPLLAPIQ